MKITIYIDAYDDDGSQKAFITREKLADLRVQPYFDRLFIMLESRSASMIAVDSITHIKVETNE